MPLVPPFVPPTGYLYPGIYNLTPSGLTPGYFDTADLRAFNRSVVPINQDYASFGISMKADWYDPFLSGDFNMMNRRTCAQIANIKAQCEQQVQNPYNLDLTS